MTYILTCELLMVCHFSSSMWSNLGERILLKDEEQLASNYYFYIMSLMCLDKILYIMINKILKTTKGMFFGKLK